MKTKNIFKIISGTLILLLCISSMQAQDVQSLLSQGTELRKQYKEPEALKKFEAVLKVKPDNVKALHNASWLVGTIGDRQTDKETKKKWFERSRKMALKAIKLANRNAEAHYSYVKALGLLSEVASSSKEKLQNAKIIKKEAETVIKLNPKHADAHYILGRWHHGISDLAWYEVTAANLLFGGVPEGASFEKAIKHYKTAIQLKPDDILNYYDLAVTYEEIDEDQKAIASLEKAIKLKPITPDDPERLKKCRELLADLK